MIAQAFEIEGEFSVATNEARFLDPAVGDWHVLHTRAQHERALCEYLDVRGIAHYLPVMPQVRYCGKRKSVTMAPLFPGYVFLRGSIEEAYTADRTRWVAGIIRVANQDVLDWEMRNIYEAMSRGATPRPVMGLRPGRRVEVRSGPWRGIQGVIDQESPGGRLILQVTTLGRAVSLEIDGSLLDSID